MPAIIINDWTKLGSTVRAERRRAQLSQQQLATTAGTSRSWLARLEAGHRGAELEQILRVLAALNLTMTLTPTTQEPRHPADDTETSIPSSDPGRSDAEASEAAPADLETDPQAGPGPGPGPETAPGTGVSFGQWSDDLRGRPEYDEEAAARLAAAEAWLRKAALPESRHGSWSRALSQPDLVFGAQAVQFKVPRWLQRNIAGREEQQEREEQEGGKHRSALHADGPPDTGHDDGPRSETRAGERLRGDAWPSSDSARPQDRRPTEAPDSTAATRATRTASRSPSEDPRDNGWRDEPDKHDGSDAQ